MKKNVEAEGGELIVRNEEGDIAIIPKNRAKEAQGYLDSDDQEGLNGLIRTLPMEENYAEDGTFLASPGNPPDEPPNQNPNNIGFTDLSTKTEKEKMIASSNAVLKEENERLRQLYGITEENKEGVLSDMFESSPESVSENIVAATAYEPDATGALSKLVEDLNAKKGFYNIKTEEDSTAANGRRLKVQAQVARYEKATNSQRDDIYIRHYNKSKANGTPYIDVIDKDKFITEVDMWKKNNKEPIYVDVDENTSLNFLKKRQLPIE